MIRSVVTRTHLLSLVVAATVLVAVAACGTSGATVGGEGGLHVVATMGPTCPVQRSGEPPCVAPYRGDIEVVNSEGTPVAHVTTTAAGVADITLSPGTYTVTTSATGASWPRLIQPVTVTVTAGATVTANLSFDTGIR